MGGWGERFLMADPGSSFLLLLVIGERMDGGLGERFLMADPYFFPGISFLLLLATLVEHGVRDLGGV